MFLFVIMELVLVGEADADVATGCVEAFTDRGNVGVEEFVDFW